MLNELCGTKYISCNYIQVILTFFDQFFPKLVLKVLPKSSKLLKCVAFLLSLFFQKKKIKNTGIFLTPLPKSILAQLRKKRQ